MVKRVFIGTQIRSFVGFLIIHHQIKLGYFPNIINGSDPGIMNSTFY